MEVKIKGELIKIIINYFKGLRVNVRSSAHFKSQVRYICKTINAYFCFLNWHLNVPCWSSHLYCGLTSCFQSNQPVMKSLEFHNLNSTKTNNSVVFPFGCFRKKKIHKRREREIQFLTIFVIWRVRMSSGVSQPASPAADAWILYFCSHAAEWTGVCC